MSERPFMQLYVSDFIGDTLQLSTEQIGAYMLLLMAMWNAGGSLPDDDAKLSRVVRMSVKKWRSISDDMMGYFDRKNGIISHQRLTKELQKSVSKSELRAAAGARGGAAKSLKNNNPPVANAKQMPKHLPDVIYYTPQPPKRGEERVDQNDVLKNGLWDAYPTGVHDTPSETQAAFDLIPEQDKPTAIAGAVAYGKQVRAETEARKKQNQPPPRIKKCARWLRDRGWEAMPKPVAASVKVDRNLDRVLFAACEEISGKPAPTTVTAWSFPAEIIEQAKQQTQAA